MTRLASYRRHGFDRWVNPPVSRVVASHLQGPCGARARPCTATLGKASKTRLANVVGACGVVAHACNKRTCLASARIGLVRAIALPLSLSLGISSSLSLSNSAPAPASSASVPARGRSRVRDFFRRTRPRSSRYARRGVAPKARRVAWWLATTLETGGITNRRGTRW